VTVSIATQVFALPRGFGKPFMGLMSHGGNCSVAVDLTVCQVTVLNGLQAHSTRSHITFETEFHVVAAGQIEGVVVMPIPV